MLWIVDQQKRDDESPDYCSRKCFIYVVKAPCVAHHTVMEEAGVGAIEHVGSYAEK